MSQAAVLSTCQTPCRFGLPSDVRAPRLASLARGKPLCANTPPPARESSAATSALVNTFRIRAPPRTATRMVTPGAADACRDRACSRAAAGTPYSVRLTGHLFHELVLSLLHLLRREIFLARGDRPQVPLRVLETARAIAPELIGHLAHGTVEHLCAGRDRAVEQCIAIRYVEPQVCWRTAVRPGASSARTHDIVHHNERIA